MNWMKRCKQGLALLFIAVLLVTTAAEGVLAASDIGKKTSSKTYIKSKDWPDGPSTSSFSAVLMDADTGTVLYAKNPDSKLYPASITKIMTALLTLENCDTSKKMTFKAEATKALPYNAVSIAAKTGEKMSIHQCLGATLIHSANDAAAGLACEVAGSIKKFSKMMNQRAEELGCKNTHFNNPHGLTDSNHWTTAYDMCLIMKECIKYDEFRELAGLRSYTIKKNNKRKKAYTFSTKHKQLITWSPYYYEYTVCGKTGYTDEAHNTLVTYAEKDGKRLICCTMKAGQGVAYVDTKKLFEWGFKNFKSVDVSKDKERFSLENLGIYGADDEAGAGVSLEMEEGKLTLPKGVSLSDLDTKLTYLKNDPDQYFAKVTYKYQKTKVGTTRLRMVVNGEAVNPTEEETEEDTTEAVTESENTAAEASVDESGEASEESGELVEETGAKKSHDIWDNGIQIDIHIAIGAVAGVIALIVLLILLNRRKHRNELSFKRGRKKNKKLKF